MPVSKEQVLATAALARLDPFVSSPHARPEHPEERLTRLASQLDAVIGYMEILDRVDTENVEPLYSPMQYTAPPRKDSAEKRRGTEEILTNAPKRQQRFFAVPPII